MAHCRLMYVCSALLAAAAAAAAVADAAMDPASTLECHRRLYTYKVTKTDADGRACWDVINVMSCWGRCDSNEISDWRFPYKRSFHPVCLHDARERRSVRLRNCEEGAAPGTERYEFLEAVSCRCAICRSSEASCEGLRYRGQRSGPFKALGRR
ncbi:thyrostimulin beta-5 subunit [Schistocerca americana]|uniref:thyrostimulin beta-5 subunit n=2 Tax=Schistocerca TaxID=7008 RepID=UPI001F4FBB59|nr:thyrostimulin beta-5 subunit [Schistocerca americana]XP_049789465.1 thyrostimulin beta-5 subunit [Schistocerca nitens]XP_049834253.1 thyrostimulin beta-5 subunit [Schistocerca gregaria]XP_049939988.1 thyrostimulin beta-5 subunit [Schistocerca serialis cubense]UGX04199.1 glycoprotein hormone beta 5 [Schistocerca gregaria]